MCPLRARSDGKSEGFTATHGQVCLPLTCINAGKQSRTRNLPSWLYTTSSGSSKRQQPYRPRVSTIGRHQPCDLLG